MRLADALRPLAVLPLPVASGSPQQFCSPKEAKVLPAPLADLFRDNRGSQHLLFGGRAVSAALLGARAQGCLQRLKLLGELEPSDIVGDWSGGAAVAAWLAAAAEKDRDGLLVTLLGALAKLDERQQWRSARLDCLPTEAGGWTSRQGLQRFPGGWDTVKADEQVQQALLPFCGPPDRLLAWRFDSYQRRDRGGTAYLQDIEPSDLESIVEAWWAHLPRQPQEEQRQLVVRFTNWIRTKMPSSKGFVKKVLAAAAGKQPELVDPAKALLADPYANAHRRSFFTSLPVIAEEYLDIDARASSTIWRDYFQGLTPDKPQGEVFDWATQLLTADDVRRLAGSGYAPPPLERKNELQWMKWHPQCYLLLDRVVKESVLSLLRTGGLSREQAASFAALLQEELDAFLRQGARPHIFYYGQPRDPLSADLPCQSRWLHQLAESRWVYATDGRGPLTPSQTLPAGAPAEDGVPIAALPEGLVQSLQRLGLAFRRPLGDASPIERLVGLGPTTEDPFRLAALLDEARTQAEQSPEHLPAFLQALELPLFKGPGGTRHRYSQLVDPLKTATARATDLAGFLLPTDRMEGVLTQAVERLQRMNGVQRVPVVASGAQIIAFLSHTWDRSASSPSGLPDEDAVKNVMPRAYGYLLEDLDRDGVSDGQPMLQQRSQSARPKARASTREGWVPVAQAMLDDVGEEAIRKQAAKVSWATAGYLGRSSSLQQRVARLLGLRLLSEQIERTIVAGEAIDTVEVQAWQGRFMRLAALLVELQRREESGVGSAAEAASPVTLHVVASLRVQTAWKDGAAAPIAAPVRALLTAGSGEGTLHLYVAGDPLDFSLEAFDQLLRRFSALRLSAALAARISMLLSSLDSSERFERTLADVCRQYEIELPGLLMPPQKPGAGEQPAPDGPGEPQPPPEGNGEPEPPAPAPTGGGPAPPQPLPAPGPADSPPRPPAPHPDGDGSPPRPRPPRGLVPGAGVDPEAVPPSLREHHDDARGRQAVRQYEVEHGRVPGPELPPQNEGFDMTSWDPVAQITRRIEVKGINDWDVRAVSATEPQFRHGFLAPEPGIEYWLYVVDDVNSTRPRIFAFRKAMQRVERFFFRADAWREHADERGDVSLPFAPLVDEDPLPDFPADAAPTETL